MYAIRSYYEQDTRYYRKWELCLSTNPNRIDTVESYNFV